MTTATCLIETATTCWRFIENGDTILAAASAIAALAIGCWAWYRPCDTCGEYRYQCRCKPRDY
jgi:hypothetical protein